LQARERLCGHQTRGSAQSDAAAQPAGTVAAVVRNRLPGLAGAADWRAVQRYRPDAGGDRLEPGRGTGAPAHGAAVAGGGPDGEAARYRVGIATRLLHRRTRAGAADARGALLHRLAARAGLVAGKPLRWKR